MKKVIALLLAAMMVFSLVACGTKTDDTATSDDTTTEEKETYVVGISQYVQHEALDAATQGFKDALEALLPGQVTFVEENCSGDASNCATVANTLVQKECDLIMANATPSLTSVVSATSDIPILGTSITAYPVALDLDVASFTGTVGGNVSGTSDLADLEKQAEMITEWFPDAKTVGLLYCSAEANSIYQVQEVAKYLTAAGITCTEYTFTDSNDVTSVTEKAAANSDVIYIPTDNTAASNTEAIANVVVSKKVPVAAGEEGICKGCGICTLSISYYDLGYTTGEMAAKILTGEADISTMAIEYTDCTPKYNADLCEQYGITPVDGYEAIAD